MGAMSQHPDASAGSTARPARPRVHGCLLFDTVIGHSALAWGQRGIVGLLLPEGSEALTRARLRRMHPDVAEMPESAAPAPVRAATERIRGLLRGDQDDLQDLPLDYRGVPAFHVRVYELVRGIGPGATLTYGEVAQRLGEPSAARAVGQALARNPFAPVVPCHRVLGAPDGAGNYRPGGFSAGGGTATKLRMLQAEGARFSRQPGLFD
jgi:methylated-DNA-[protein]-cysteine S-methyltransferase